MPDGFIRYISSSMRTDIEYEIFFTIRERMEERGGWREEMEEEDSLNGDSLFVPTDGKPLKNSYI